MSLSSNRRIINEFSGDYTFQAISTAAENSATPGQMDSPTLSSGNNTITPPTGAQAVTIVMPSGNTTLVTLKGVNGDTGIPLHLTDPTSIALHTTSTFVLSAASGLTGIRLIWS